MSVGYIPNILDMQGPSMFDGIQGIWSPPSAAMAAQPARDPDLARRMRLLRQAVGKRTNQEMADFLDVTLQRWNNVEKGMPLGKDLATIIKAKVPGVDLDWLLEGDLDGLALHLREALAGPPPMPSAPEPRSRARRASR